MKPDNTISLISLIIPAINPDGTLVEDAESPWGPLPPLLIQTVDGPRYIKTTDHCAGCKHRVFQPGKEYRCLRRDCDQWYTHDEIGGD